MSVNCCQMRTEVAKTNNSIKAVSSNIVVHILMIAFKQPNNIEYRQDSDFKSL